MEAREKMDLFTTIMTVVVGPLMIALIAGVKWVFDKMESRLQKEIDELKLDRKILQTKVDQMLAEAIAEQRALVIAYQKSAEASRQVSMVVDTNTKVIETLTASKP